MATKFADLAKVPKDLLNDDFTSKYSLKCKKDAGSVGVTIEAEQGSDGKVAAKIGTKFSYAKFNVDKGQLKADGDRVLETSLAVTPEIKMFFKANKTADLIVEYVKGGVYGTAAVDVLDLTKASGSVCLTHGSGLKIGGDVGYGFRGAKTGLISVSAGAAFGHGPVGVSLVASNKFAQYEIGLLYKVNSDLTLASVTTHSAAKSCDVVGIGASYKAKSIGTIKAKFGMDHVVHTCVTREVAPKVLLTASASFKPSDLSTFKHGMSISM